MALLLLCPLLWIPLLVVALRDFTGMDAGGAIVEQ
jgi:hypothetical protein